MRRSHAVPFVFGFCLLHFLGHIISNSPQFYPNFFLQTLIIALWQPFIDDEHVLQVSFPIHRVTPFFRLSLQNSQAFFVTYPQSFFPARHYALAVPAVFLFSIVSVALLFVARVLSKSSALI
jgi:hypothetical protein